MPRKPQNPRVMFQSDDSEESAWVRQFLRENGISFIERPIQGVLLNGPVITPLDSDGQIESWLAETAIPLNKSSDRY